MKNVNKAKGFLPHCWQNSEVQTNEQSITQMPTCTSQIFCHNLCPLLFPLSLREWMTRDVNLSFRPRNHFFFWRHQSEKTFCLLHKHSIFNHLKARWTCLYVHPCDQMLDAKSGPNLPNKTPPKCFLKNRCSIKKQKSANIWTNLPNMVTLIPWIIVAFAT